MCVAPAPILHHGPMACNVDFSWPNHQDTRDFIPGWAVQKGNKTASYVDAAFHHFQDNFYHSEYWGEYGTYTGTGYIVFLPRNVKRSKEIVKDLQESQWIDRYTTMPEWC